jgi:hypothetical protein
LETTISNGGGKKDIYSADDDGVNCFGALFESRLRWVVTFVTAGIWENSK